MALVGMAVGAMAASVDMVIRITATADMEAMVVTDMVIPIMDMADTDMV